MNNPTTSRRTLNQRRRMTIILGVLGVAGLATFLVLAGLSASVAYFYTPTDLAKATPPPQGLIRLGGLVAIDSVVRPNPSDNATPSSQKNDAQSALVQFTIEDEFEQTIVRFEGVLPDLFREGQGVVVQGRLAPDGALNAIEVLAKHDETYIPKEVADALKEQGRWQEGGAE